MKYTKPLFLNENVEASDVVATSIVSVQYTQKGTGEYDTDGNEIMVDVTQVTVDVGGLF